MPVCRVAARLLVVSLVVLFSTAVEALAQTAGTFKLAFYNIQSGKGEPGLPGRPMLFTDNGNCTDPSQPMNAWGVGFVQQHLREAIVNDPSVVALGLAEAWACGSPERVRSFLGWKSRTGERNGVALLAKYGFAGAEEWVQLDTSLNANPSDTMWVVRAPVCLDAACTQSITVFAAHWYSAGTSTMTDAEKLALMQASYDRQAVQTTEFLRRAGGMEPHVLIGDLNTWEGTQRVCNQDPINSGLNRLRDAGYVDAWPVIHGSAEGFTGMTNRAGCGFPEGYVWKRPDYVWSPASFMPLSMARFGMVAAGDAAPSDHYGVIAEFPLAGVGGGAPAPTATTTTTEPTTTTTTTTTTTATSTTTTSTTPQSAPAPSAPGAGDVVLHAAHATVVGGGWQLVPDPQAASGVRAHNPDKGAAKLSSALASPASYVELTFTAEAGRAYRLWIRGIAERNSWANDSVFVQFSGSVAASGTATHRIGTTAATWINLEDGSNTGLSSWGWQDNGYGVGVLGAVVYFTAGQQTIRIQSREDGFSFDQIVLSPEKYMSAAPGALKNDATILAPTGVATTATTTEPTTSPAPAPAETTATAPTTSTSSPTTAESTTQPTAGETTTTPSTTSSTSTTSTDPVTSTTSPTESTVSATEIVLLGREAVKFAGTWSFIADTTAAGGIAVGSPDVGAAKPSAAAAAPAHFVEFTFQAEAGKPYRLWLRGRADRNSWANDSVFVQFSDSVSATGAPIWRIGTTDSTFVNLEDGANVGISGWGWQDNGYGAGVLGPLVTFATSGAHTIRIQTREDGFRIDQIVLSSHKYLQTAPGALKNDATILR